MTATQETDLGTEATEVTKEISPVRKRSANLEIALTETGLVLGTMIGNLVAERVAKGTHYYIPITFAGGIIGAATGRGFAELYYTINNYVRKQD